MAQVTRQNVSTPKFYLDYIQYGLTIGSINVDDFGLPDFYEGTPQIFGQADTPSARRELASLFYLNPINRLGISTDTFLQNDKSTLAIPSGIASGGADIKYMAILGHNLKNANMAPGFLHATIDAEGNYDIANFLRFDADSSINLTAVTLMGGGGTDYNGWTLAIPRVTDVSEDSEYLEFSVKKLSNDTADSTLINTISIGTTYEIPHSPDLRLTMTREFDGIKHITTKGGSTLTNINYHQRPNWYSFFTQHEPWGLAEPEQTLDTKDRSQGRRVWNLKFSHIADTDIMPELDLTNTVGWESATAPTTTYTDSGFFSKFMRLTLGGNLRFIFQADKDDLSPDGFAICMLDQKSISIRQSSFKTYDISLKIKEAW